MAQLRRKLSDRYLLALAFFAGLVIRLLWQIKTFGSLTLFRGWGEASNVALALSHGRGFADAYYPGSGPTAHLLPLNPLAASFWFWMFGPGSAGANVGLLAMSLGQVGLSYWLLMRLFERLGFEDLAVRWSTITLCVLPFFVQTEVIAFRYWDGATAVCLMCANMLRLIELSDRAHIRSGDLIVIALLCAITIFVTLPIGFGVTMCWTVFALRKLVPRQIAQLALAGAVALTVLVAPWAIRNEVVLGHPVLLRSNAGLELALAYHPAAVSDADPEVVGAARYAEIHPFGGGRGRDALNSAGGEVVYYQRLGAAARSWIISHPADVAVLSLRHLREFYFPPTSRFAGAEPNGRPFEASIWVSLTNLVGLLALLSGLIQGRKGYGMLATCLFCITLTYIWTSPTPRYTYLVYGPLLFLAADGIVRLWIRASDTLLSRSPNPLPPEPWADRQLQLPS
jgi:hypothetical protein